MIALVVSFLAALTGTPASTRATRYGDPGDKLAGGRPACWRRCLEWSDSGACVRRFTAESYRVARPRMIANRWLPCGSIVAIRRVSCSRTVPGACAAMGRVALGVVLDRGPFGQAARLPGDARRPVLGHGKRSARHAVWRGDLDLSPGVADSLSLSLHEGRAGVEWWVIGQLR